MLKPKFMLKVLVWNIRLGLANAPWHIEIREGRQVWVTHGGL